MVDAIFNFYATENEAVRDQVQLAQYFLGLLALASIVLRIFFLNNKNIQWTETLEIKIKRVLRPILNLIVCICPPQPRLYSRQLVSRLRWLKRQGYQINTILIVFITSMCREYKRKSRCLSNLISPAGAKLDRLEWRWGRGRSSNWLDPCYLIFGSLTLI